MATDYEDVLDVFYSTIREKYELDIDLLEQWFVMSCRDYELDIAPLNYDANTQMFPAVSGATVNILGIMMARYYVKREQSRINKLNNIIGRDLRLNATGDAKKAVQVEYENILLDIEKRLHKLKTHVYS